MRYFITLSYDGTRYHGWQIQPNGISVQEELQRALSTLLRQPIEVVGAGRTDAGVHASMMVAHFEVNESTSQQVNESASQQVNESTSQRVNESASLRVNESMSQLCYKLNKILPQDIAVQKVESVADDMHARFSAVERTYHYFVHLKKDPFQRAYSWRIPYKVDFDKMNEAAKVLLGTHDFTSFSKTNTDTKTNICTVTEARWEKMPAPDGPSSLSEDTDVGTWRFTIKANRFLRNMVRAVVGTLVEVGRGKMSIDELQRVIDQKDRCKAGESVPGHALFLVDIKY